MQKRERTMMGLPAGFQKAYDMVWYFSNYGKELSCHIPTQILPQGLVNSIQMVKFLELNAQRTTTR